LIEQLQIRVAYWYKSS